MCSSVSSTTSTALADHEALGPIRLGPTCARLVPNMNPDCERTLRQHGISITPLEPMGAAVTGLDLRLSRSPPADVLKALEVEMAGRGFVVFRDQGVMTGDEQVRASELFGGKKIYSTHGVHPKAPNRHIFRLSNDPSEGLLGVGPQWHNDGSFERAVFSHVGYHIVRVPERGGATHFSHAGAAHDRLTEEEKEVWSRRFSVNSNSGVVHPLVHTHPISGRRSVWLHLGWTGAVIEASRDGEAHRLLDAAELTALCHRFNDLLDAGFKEGYSMSYEYQAGDLVMIDNLAISHRAAPQAHMSTAVQGLRILHRTTVAGMMNFDPVGLPPEVHIFGPSPFGRGVWQGGGQGFQWDATRRLQN
eukprot:CAMPEP_0177656756 /NCGR_PEP_ID=MMETSP0447-20121125/15765_1 /TAXON_ID=0 /ORGANISM="Stygamoeba regulata, Strain BSH-02190019" /LENGTH=359 /DNA_ID=CAMNT_0019160953 /DNA_START=249 /DNA_END=1328 /DNA_ORIENTATION=+